jgi:glyoxylase-like metal-dependent hydrolase (beta-lactamase superfamily II)
VPLLIELKKECCEVFPIIVPNASFSLKTVNFYLVKQENSLSLIDAGWNNTACWEALNITLKKNGFKLNDLTEIILTHHHIDHIGLVNRIVSEHPIPVYTHPDSIPRLKRDKDFLEMRAEFYAKLYHQMGCGKVGEARAAYLRKAIVTNKDEAIEGDISAIRDNMLLNFQVINVPGHAPDQLAFLDQRENRLFGGDLLIEHISSNALVEPDSFGNRIPSLSQHIDSLTKLLGLDVKLVFSGHGGLIKNPNALTLKRLERIEAKGDRLTQLIQSGITTASEIAYVNYKNTYYEQFDLVMSEIIGHLDYLESNGKIEKELVKGIWHYNILKH